jgi:hypothetical protein
VQTTGEGGEINDFNFVHNHFHFFPALYENSKGERVGGRKRIRAIGWRETEKEGRNGGRKRRTKGGGLYSRMLAIPLRPRNSSKEPRGTGDGSPPALLGSENTSPNAKILCMRACDTTFFLRSTNRNCSLTILNGWPVRRLHIGVFHLFRIAH